MTERERAETPGECDLALVVKGLIPKEHDLVLEQCAPDPGDGLGVEVVGDVDAAQLGPDRPGNGRDFEAASCLRAFVRHASIGARSAAARNCCGPPCRDESAYPGDHEHHARGCNVEQQAAGEV